jgi:Flp pilus assembly protein TadG
MMRRPFHRLTRDRRASAGIEFVVCGFAISLLAGGVFELGSLMVANAQLNRLAMQYANSYADCSDATSGACQTELNLYVSSTALEYMAPQLTPADVSLTMAQVKMNGSTPSIDYIYPTGGSLTAAQTTALTAATSVGTGQTGVVVTVTYPYRLLIFSTLMAPIIGSSWTLTYTVAQLK